MRHTFSPCPLLRCFPSGSRKLDIGVVRRYAMCMLAATVFFYLYIPETTGISLEQLAKLSEGKDPHTGKPL